MKKFTEKLVAVVTAATALASTLAISSSAVSAVSGTYIGTGAIEKDYSYKSGPMYYYGTFESGALYNTYFYKYVDGYLSILRFTPVNSSTTYKTLKTHCVLRSKPSSVPATFYTDYPLSDGAPVSIDSSFSLIVGLAANYYDSGAVAVSDNPVIVTNAEVAIADRTTSIQTNSKITTYGSVQYTNGNRTIAGYYQINNR